MNGRLGKAQTKAKTVLDGFTTGQKAIVAVAVVGLVLGAVFLSRLVAQPALTPLFGNLSGSDANAIVEQLQASGVKYELTDGGHTVMVPQSQVYDLRVQMSGKGLPAGSDSAGYSLLDSKGGLTQTDFQQNVTYRRALEGELSKTLQAMDGVNTAVVHLALPKKDVFATEQDRPTASVLLQLRPGVAIGRDQVRSVTHLVAGSVEGLSPDDVTVTDSTGKLLSSPETGVNGASSAAGEADQQTAAFEARRAGEVQAMLDRVLGPGHATVQVNATLNFDSTETVSEKYQPIPSVSPTAESSSDELYNSAVSGNGGALGQTWPTLSPQPSATGAGSYRKSNGAKQVPIDKSVVRSQGAPGKVEKLSAAVILDAKADPAPDPAKVQALVEKALGIDTTRGDSVQVDSMAFDTTAAAASAKELATQAKQAQLDSYLDLGKKSGLVLLGLIMLFLLSRRGKKKAKVSATVADLPASPFGGGNMLIPAQPGPAAITATIEALPSADELAAERERIRERVATLVDNQPEDVAAVIQSWLSERSVS
ncbi:MAG: flagellar basal-body MS-ring/collar protein FliF [Kineosporiaceae bacterium]